MVLLQMNSSLRFYTVLLKKLHLILRKLGKFRGAVFLAHPVHWTSSFKYPGINGLSDLCLKVDISCIKRSFYKCCNGILSHC